MLSPLAWARVTGSWPQCLFPYENENTYPLYSKPLRQLFLLSQRLYTWVNSTPYPLGHPPKNLYISLECSSKYIIFIGTQKRKICYNQIKIYIFKHRNSHLVLPQISFRLII